MFIIEKISICIRKLLIGAVAVGAVVGIVVFPEMAMAAGQDSLLSVTEEAQVQPISDGSGKYLMKSNGFYCLNVSGGKDAAEAVHYFRSYEIDGTVFDGYYYHDADGKFKAGNPHLVHLKAIPVVVKVEDNLIESVVFDGFYMADNLGKLSAAPQVRYLDNVVVDNVTFNGYYYFNENGRLVEETGIHYLDMVCNGQSFKGSYYFGGQGGALLQEELITEDGLIVEETGRIKNMDELGVRNLKQQLERMLEEYPGEWSVYVKDLNTDDSILINDKQYYSASLIKAFVMAKTYNDLEAVNANEAVKLNTSDMETARAKVEDLLWNMITVSDNESFNELVRLQTEDCDFIKGAETVNEYLEKEGYSDTNVQHTLHPSPSNAEGLGERNVTSAKDCGLLLERIYKGECVNEEASKAMMNLFLHQEMKWKIPKGLPSGVESGNKTGETDEDQHDIAIVFGEKTTYILCVMSEGFPNQNDAMENISKISRVVYNYLNL